MDLKKLPTPRTDNEEFNPGEYHCDKIVDAEFARMLELEIVALRKVLIECQDHILSVPAGLVRKINTTLTKTEGQ